MLSEPKVSVLTALYKTNPNHLREAIESVLNQTFTYFEFLLLNDSPEDTELDKIVSSYKDKRIKYFKNEKNLGITPSRNRLMELAKGEYLAVFDHDDICHPTRLEKEVAYLDAHPETAVVSSWIHSFPKNKTNHNPEQDAEIKVALMEHDVIAHSACMLRKSVLVKNKICYEEDFSPAEDYALFMRLMDVADFYNIQEPLLEYRIHENNTTKKQWEKMEKAAWRVRSLIRAEHPALYSEYMLRAKHTTKIQLFGFIPLFKLETTGYKTKVYLFNKILVFKIKKNSRLGEK
ncbi:MAG: glycosyltransferase [Alphaproteobacteria bacterium]|nr:glycosyltransferase [Alphaproteobacteria bacterium]